MSGVTSKRAQARNERALQELIKGVPGNNVCADCQAKNPGWASWSLGIFLCMRCAALHRKLGTHITKVKSLSMDSWSTEQVETMRRMGNFASNRKYNPSNTRPPIPIDADEADSAMERFIRQKYVDRTAKAAQPQMTGSTGESYSPPPLPPKTGGRFGFRSASSIFPLSSKSKREAAARQEFDQDRRSPSPPPKNKPSKIFGQTVSRDIEGDLEFKMVRLREMGFRDEKRNMAVLKGLGGNLEKSVETLVRLGEGQAPVPVPKTGSDRSGLSSRSRTPLSPVEPTSGISGITINRTRGKSPPKSAPLANPWAMLDAPRPPAKPQSSQSTGSMQPQSPLSPNNPYHQLSNNNTNPFGLMPSQSQVNLNHAFQNMSVSNSQPLFPNHTGGFPGPQPTPQQQRYQQSMTPPVPSLPQQYYPPVIYENPAQQPQQNSSYNPFLQQQAPQVQQQLQPQAPPIDTNFQNNPFLQQQSLGGSQSMYNSPVDLSPSQYRQPALHSYQNQQHLQSNPFLQNQQHQVQQQVEQPQSQQQFQNYQAQQQQHYQQFPVQTHPILLQQTERADKRTILDLYNYPQLAPQLTSQPLLQNPQQQSQGSIQSTQNQNILTQQPNAQQQMNVTNPISPAGSNNPFMTAGGGAVQGRQGEKPEDMMLFASAANGPRHVSQESVSIDVGGWQNGRHSPDAWGNISGRSMR